MQEFTPDEPDYSLFEVVSMDTQDLYGEGAPADDSSLPLIPEAEYAEDNQAGSGEWNDILPDQVAASAVGPYAESNDAIAFSEALANTHEHVAAADPDRSREGVVLRPDDTVTVETRQFPIAIMGIRDFIVAVGSETLGTHPGASALVINDRPAELKDIVENFSDGARICADLELRPGVNTIAISLEDSAAGQPEEYNVTLKVPGRTYESGGIEFLLHEKSTTVNDTALDEIAALTRLMNGYLEKPVTEIFIRDGEYPAGSATGGELGLSRFNFENPDRYPNEIAWHELAHFYYNELEGEDYYLLDEDQRNAYGREFTTLYEEALELSLVADIDETVRKGWNAARWTDIRSNSVMEVFNSETYIDTKDPNLGHPQSHAGELFAYGSDVLTHHSEAFLQRVSRLKTEEEKSLALQLATKIAGAYSKNGNLPETLQALGQFVETRGTTI